MYHHLFLSSDLNLSCKVHVESILAQRQSLQKPDRPWPGTWYWHHERLGLVTRRCRWWQVQWTSVPTTWENYLKSQCPAHSNAVMYCAVLPAAFASAPLSSLRTQNCGRSFTLTETNTSRFLLHLHFPTRQKSWLKSELVLVLLSSVRVKSGLENSATSGLQMLNLAARGTPNKIKNI